MDGTESGHAAGHERRDASGDPPGPASEPGSWPRGIRAHAGHPLRAHGRFVPEGTPAPADGRPPRLAGLIRDLAGPPAAAATTGVAILGDPRHAGLAAAMVGWTLHHAGLDPTVVLDRFAPQVGGWGRAGSGAHAVAQVEPGEVGAEVVVCLDDPSDPGRHAGAFRDQVARAEPGDYLLGYAGPGDPGDAVGRDRGVDVEWFSLAQGREWWGADLRESRGCARFRTFHRGRFVAEIQLRVPGPGMVVAALAAVAACVRAEVPPRGIKEALEEFAGVSRGFESRGSYRGVTLVDDEATSPAAVAEVLDLVRRIHGPRRVCVAYRPDPAPWSPSPAAAGPFARADRVWVVDGAGPDGGARAESVAGALRGAGARVDRVACPEEAVRELDRELEPGDVLVTLGAGDVGTIADAFFRRLSRHRDDGRPAGPAHLVPAGGARRVSGSPA